MKTKKGFTLIELLVVIAIIAILAAILFPVFARARDKARQTTCLSNCKQIALGILMYADDYDEVFPAAGARLDITVPTPANDNSYYGGWNNTASHPTWTVVQNGETCMETNFKLLIQPYIKTTKIFHCPNDAAWPTSSSYWANSYGKGSEKCSPLGGIDWYAWRPVSATQDAGGTIMLFCAPLNANYSNIVDLGYQWTIGFFGGYGTAMLYAGLANETPYNVNAIPGNQLDPNNPYNTCVPYFGSAPCKGALLCTVWPVAAYGASPWTQVHNGGTNYAFADGHAKWYRIEQTVSKTDPVTGEIIQHDMWTRNPND